MKNGLEYEKVKIEILQFDGNDIITASNGDGNGTLGESDWNNSTDPGGWT